MIDFEEQQKQIEEETELDCLFWIKHSKVKYKKEYPKNIDLDDYYVDQSPKNFKYCYVSISSILLKLGLQRIDSWFMKQILYDSKYSKQELEEMIKKNPHLHNVIKTNLLDNLNYKK